jgi:hypothetical protein
LYWAGFTGLKHKEIAMGDLSKDFDSSEFFKTDTYQRIKSGNRLPAWYIDANLIYILQELRDHFKKPIKITSGFATPAENITRGSTAEWSMHIFGKAADFVVEGVDAKTVQGYLRKKYKNIGLGCGVDFTHIDTRNTKEIVEWKY